MKTWLFYTLLCAVLVSTGCHSVEKMLDEGRYDELLRFAEKKLSGKKLNKAKYVIAIEDAFRKVTAQDMARIERLKSGNRSADWEEIMSIATKIDRRQERLTPYLPLIADDGYRASFNFVKTVEILTYAESQIVEALYLEGNSQLRLGRTGDKRAAQIAFKKFQEILDRRGDIRDVARLRDESRDLGIVRVLTAVDNRAVRWMPAYVAEILDESVTGMQSSFWMQYFQALPAETPADYIARLVIHHVEAGPESVTNEEIPKHRKIEDGWEYVLDARGNVAKDSLGNDIKVTKYRDVSAVIVRTIQEKGVFLKGTVELIDPRTQQILETRPVHVEHRFRYQAQSFYGDERALNKSADRVVIAPAPFPGDGAMFMTLAEMVRPAFHRELSRFRSL